jgi:hypothetical protein
MGCCPCFHTNEDHLLQVDSNENYADMDARVSIHENGIFKQVSPHSPKPSDEVINQGPIESDENEKLSRSRFQCYKELYETERNYIKDIMDLFELFYTPLREESNMKQLGISIEDIDIIFSKQLEILLNVNSQLLRKLEKGFEFLEKNKLEGAQQKIVFRRGYSTT